jgi:hypothetical protein
MSRKMNAAAFALACATLIGAGAASAAPEAEDAKRDRLAEQLVERWSGYVERTFKLQPKTWKQEMAPLLREVPMEDLELAVAAANFDKMNDTLLGPEPSAALSSLGPSDGSGTLALGDVDRDLVYVPITPCRIFDTRLVGGSIAATTTRSFDVTAVTDYTFQGGNASNCGGAGAAGSFAAAVINITAVTPAGNGFLTAYPFGVTRPLAATMVFNAGSLVSNEAIIKLDQGASANEVTVYSSSTTHVVGDITGYFILAPLPVLQCVKTAKNVEDVAAGGTNNVEAPLCAAGYVETATECETSSWEMPLVYQSNGTCSARNNAGSTSVLRAGRVCCRVAGE